MPTKALINELFEHKGMPRHHTRKRHPYYTDSKLIYPAAFMPAVSTEELPQDIREPVRRGIEEVRKEDPVGIIEERYDGKVPVGVDRNPPYAGVTEFSDNYRNPEARRIGISNRLGPKTARRVAKHEARHVRSERLLRYKDVPERLAILIMESYAEYGGFKAAEKAGKIGEGYEILRNTPYPGAVKFGSMVDKYYISNYDKKRGYEAFIRDIQKNGSMAKTLTRLEDSIRGNTRTCRIEDLRRAA